MRRDLAATILVLASALAAPSLAAPGSENPSRGMVALSIVGTSLPEGDAGLSGAMFQVFASPAPVILTTVEFIAVDGSATTQDNDYQPAMGIVTFMPGEVMQTVVVQVVGDTTVEPDEDFSVQLLNPTGQGFINVGLAAATITNDDAAVPPTLSIGDVEITEGDTGTQDAVFEVTLSNPPATGVISVGFGTRDGGAQAGTDYQATNGSVVFDLGSRAGRGPGLVQNVTVPVFGDTVFEDDEMFFVDLFLPDGAMVVDSEGQGTILNDDMAPPPIDPTVDITGPTPLAEGNTGTVDAVFTIMLSKPAIAPVTVDVATMDGTATAADFDYQPIARSFVLAPGETQASVVVKVIGDPSVESDETFQVALIDADGGILGTTVATGTILNDDDAPPPPPPPPPPPVVAIANAVPVTEGDDGTIGAVFQVTLSAPADDTVQVEVTSMDGTATVADEDYLPIATTVIFAPGQTQVPVTVEVVGDTAVEPDETFELVLANPDGATLGVARATGTILDDDEDGPVDPLPTLSVDDVSVSEGDDGTSNAVFTVSLSAPSAAEVQVDLGTRDGTATAADGDYLPTGQTLVFAPGVTTATLGVPVVGDTVPEATETFFVELSNPRGALIADPQGQGSIVNDDLPSATIGDARVVEGDAGNVVATFSVSLSAPAATAVAVDFSTVDGSASAADNDFRAAAGTVAFAPGTTAGEVEVTVLGDLEVEGDETFSVRLSNPVGATIASARGTGTIVDDDEISRLALLPVTAVMEDSGPLAVTVERSGGSDGPASATVRTVAGSATAGDDFTAIAETVTWAAGELGPRTIEIAVIDDDLQEDDETLTVVLESPVGATLLGPVERSTTIVDDDAAMRLAAVDEQQREAMAGEEVELTVRAVRDDGEPVRGARVTWQIEGDAELLGDAEQTTDEDGIAQRSIRLGRRPGEVRVTATLAGLDSAVGFVLQVAGDLRTTFVGEEGNEARVAGVLDVACATAEGSLAEGCDYLFGLDDDDRRAAVTALTPADAATQGTAAVRGPRTQAANVLSRLGALRSASRSTAGVSIAQLSFDLRGETLGLAGLGRQSDSQSAAAGPDPAKLDALISAALAEARPAEARPAGTRPAEARPVQGRMAADLPKAANPVAPQGESESEAAAFDTGESPWGLFVNGRVSIGDAPRTRREAGYDLETNGLTAGADYRLSERLVIGGAFGYLRTDTEVDGTSGRGGLDVRGYSVSAYGTYFGESFFVDGLVSYGWNDYDLARVIDLPQPFRGQTRLIARASPGGEQVSINLGAGYDATVGVASVGGFARLGWASADIDGYREQGADPFDLTVGSQTVESLLAEVGVELAYPVSLSWGVLQPSLRVAVLHELEDDSRLIRARFSLDRSNTELVVATDDPDRDFINVGLALTATLTRGWAAYLQYDTDLARDDLDIGTFAAGFRLQL